MIYRDKKHFTVSRASCTPFVELPGFALRPLEPVPVFNPFVDESRAKKIGPVDDVGMQACMAPVNPVKKKRGEKFVIHDAKAYVDAVKRMKPSGGHSKAVFTSYHYYAAERIVLTIVSCQ